MTKAVSLEPIDSDADPAPEVRRRCIAVTLSICLLCVIGLFTWPEPNWSPAEESVQQQPASDSRPTASAQLIPATTTRYR